MNYLYPNYAKWQSRFLLIGTQLVIIFNIKLKNIYIIIVLVCL